MLCVKLNEQPPDYTLYPKVRESEHFCPRIDLLFSLVQLSPFADLGVEAQSGEGFSKHLRRILYLTNDYSLSELGAHGIVFQF